MSDHTHVWHIVPMFSQPAHKPPRKHKSYDTIKFCDCGIYKTEELVHEEDSQ